MTSKLQAEPVLSIKAELGESPVWDEASDVLWWVDWSGGTVFRSDVRAGASVSFDVGADVAAVALTTSSGVVLAQSHGFTALDPTSGAVRTIANAEAADSPTRMCDAKPDPEGRFWGGTTALDGVSPVGGLYVLERDGRVRRVLDNVAVSNGLGWSPDHTTFYYIDSATQRVDAFDFDAAAGSISNRRMLVAVPPEEGMPDGLCVDGEGGVWVALWDGWQVRRYTPDGDLDVIVELPVARPTCCAFGGKDLSDLFITTAEPDSAEEREAQPLAGRVFAVRQDIAGRPADRVCL